MKNAKICESLTKREKKDENNVKNNYTFVFLLV